MVAKVVIQKGPGYHEIDGRKPDAAQTAADEAEQLDFPGGCTRTKLAAALPDCRGKLTQVVMWRTENEGKCRSRSPDLSLEVGDRGALAECIEAAFSQVLLRHRSACLSQALRTRDCL